MSSFYPILVDLQGKKALVVGGGKVAQRKIEIAAEYLLTRSSVLSRR